MQTCKQLVHETLGKQSGSDNTGYETVTPGNLPTSRRRYGSLERREIPREFIARFHAKYQIADGCWLWQAGKFANGYGMFNLGRYANGKQHTVQAHRVAYVLATGDIPQGKVVRHSCDVPACVNPAHLLLGTQADNVNDAAAQGHYSVPKKYPLKLSDAQVIEIRTSPETGRSLAKRFDVSTATISGIRRGKRRQHVLTPAKVA